MRRAALNVAEVVGPGDLVLYQGARPPSGSEASPSSTALLRKFSPRLLPGSWSATEQTKTQVVSRLLGEPFTVDSAQRQRSRGRGLVRMLEWLEGQPGETWQDRWIAGEAEAEGNVAWRRLPAQWLTCAGYAVGDSDQSRLTLARAMSLLVSGDVIRPSLGCLLTPAAPRGLVAELARTRDPNGFATLTTLCESSGVNFHTTQLALRRIATIVAAKGGQVADINIGDCLDLLRIVDDVQASASASSPYFYQLLRTAGIFGERAPAVRALKTKGQLSCEQLIDRYAIACGPIRDLLVDYVRERQPGVDYATPHKLSYTLGRLFWRDLETHHPGSARCVCPPRSRPPGISGSTLRSAGSRTATGNPARKRCRGSTRPST